MSFIFNTFWHKGKWQVVSVSFPDMNALKCVCVCSVKDLFCETIT